VGDRLGALVELASAAQCRDAGQRRVDGKASAIADGDLVERRLDV